MNTSDFLSNPLKVGDYISYAALEGRSAVLRLGQILEIAEKPPYAGADEDDGKVIKLKVKSGYRAWTDGSIQRQKDVWLAFPTRVVKIEKPSEDIVAVFSQDIKPWAERPW